jgi:formate hydrogenlyase subunit 3/multisubunit Na+/H+ antiporter MnhD subunit
VSGPLLAAALTALLVSAAAAVLVSRRPRTASAIAVIGAVVGSVCALAAAVPVLLGAGDAAVLVPIRFAGESVVLGIDPLSALFVALIGFLGVPAAIFGLGYLGGHGPSSAAARAHAMLDVLLAGLILVVTARSALVFLLAWEVMTISAYLLVVFEHESAEVRAAGMRYLVASHLAWACILAFFAVLGRDAGSLAYADLAAAGARLSVPAATALFVLALLGFGTKAGLVPLHVWLPQAHPAAPSHVSALMSGVLIKTGVYALLRSLQFLGPPQLAFGITLVVAGGASAVYGIAFSLGQRDLKRVLAYSSIENVGLIVLGIGLAQMAAALGEPRIALLAAAGALVHLLHHGMMKAGLFLGAGAVVHATGTRDIERMGGLLRRMPRTAAAFLASAAAISALPPLCGFVGEWLLLSAAVLAAGRFAVAPAVVAVVALLAIVVAGALAAASFLRVFSVVFLGTPRSDAARDARAGSALLIGPPLALALCCFLPGLFPGAVLSLVARAAAAVAGAPTGDGVATDAVVVPIAYVGFCGLLLVSLVLALVWLRRAFGAQRIPGDVATWGCGYAGPGGRFQYTASSFGQPLVQALSGILAPRATLRSAQSLFPAGVAAGVRVPDRVDDGIVEPLSRVCVERMAIVRRFQDGRINRYVMFIVGTLVLGLGWAVASRWVLGT